jgi:hypothetical protein
MSNNNNNSPRQGRHTLHAQQLPEWASSPLTMATPETFSEDPNHPTPYRSVWDDWVQEILCGLEHSNYTLYLNSNIVPHRLTDDTVSHLPEISILQAHQRAKGAALLSSRALSSADEGGPAHKKLRAATRGMEKAYKSVAAADDAHSKKARARPALTLVNLFSSAGRRPQPTATSSRHAPAAGNRSDRDGSAPGGATRRSARLMGTGSRPRIPSKVGELTPVQKF